MSHAPISTAQAVVETMLRHGIDTIYGLPGVHNDPFFDACFEVRSRLRVIHTRHEQGAAYMALGAALVTGRPQVCAVVPGPGFLNTGAALLTAHGMNAPVVALVGQIPQRDIDRGLGHLHEIRDQLGLARHFTKFAARIDTPEAAPGVIAEAIREAVSGRMGPVMVECAMDTWARTGPVAFPAIPLLVPRPPIDDRAIAAAAAILERSECPLIVVGGGAQRASAEVIALAELVDAPVVAYRRGQGVLPATHRLHINLPIAHRLWPEVDCVVAIGTRMLYPATHWGLDADLAVVRIDIDPDEATRFDPAAAIVGDATDGTAALIKQLSPTRRSRQARDDRLHTHRAWFAGRRAQLEPQVGFLDAIRAALPATGVFVDEVTQVGFASRLVFPVLAPLTYFSPGYQDNLGWGLGAALGVKAARPDLAVVAITGDGGFMYQASELATAVQHNIAVVVVVFDNGMFGNVHLIQAERFGGRFIADRLQNPDFVALATSFGAAGLRATTASELEQSIRTALALDRPALIHVPCGEMPSPWDLIFMPRVRGAKRGS